MSGKRRASSVGGAFPRPVEPVNEAGQSLCASLAYLYDGTLEGLFSAIFAAYERHEDPEDVVPESAFQPRFGQEAFVVATDFGRAVRVRRGIERAAGAASFRCIQRAVLCESAGVGTAVYRFVRYVMARPRERRSVPVLDELGNPAVAAVVQFEKHAMNEAEYLRQFVRFSHLSNGVWYARCAPNAAVVPLVMGHFSARLNDQAFIIYDERHHMAGVYDGVRWSLVSGDALNVPPEARDESFMQEAWKRFYDTLSIDARYNPELRRHFMPMRLRENLTEMHPRQASG